MQLDAQNIISYLVLVSFLLQSMKLYFLVLIFFDVLLYADILHFFIMPVDHTRNLRFAKHMYF